MATGAESSRELPPAESRVATALIEAGMALASAMSLEGVLQVLVDVVRELLEARYAALGVINAEGTGLSGFITSGMTPAERARIGPLPVGRGILGLLIREQRPIRLRDLREHAASSGVPKHHPVMRSFAGVPIVANGRVFGNFYVTDKIGADEFSEADLAVLQVLAVQAAVAIERARLRMTHDRLVAASTHALGNALAGIRLSARGLLLAPPSTSAEWLEGVRRIAGGADQAARVVDDLVALAEIHTGHVELRATSFDVRALLRECASDLEAEAAVAGVALVVDAGAPVPVDLDRSRTKRVLGNLFAHGIAVSPAGATVRAECTTTPGGGATIIVHDEGPPWGADTADALFEPNTRSGVLTHGRSPGFELAVSRQLARMMGGELSVERTDAGGATFTLSLPQRLPGR
jgi:signal transduction histidine kinase